jgi:5-methylcytosine-specific restriction endonuclease McrA
MPTRTCKLCQGEFPATLEFFYKHPGGAFGLNNVCKPCARARARASEQARKNTPEYKISNAAKSRGYHARHRDQSNERARRWREVNPEAARNHQILRVERLKAAGHYTRMEWADKVTEYHNRCHWCKKLIHGKPAVDHVIPISRGGLNTIENVVPSCAPCNQSKHNALPEEFLARRPDLQPF